MRIASIVFFTALVLAACSTPQLLERTNLAYLYQSDGLSLRQHFVVFHKSADSTVVFFEGDGGQLLYIKDANYPDYIARLRVKYRLYTDFQRTTLLDSGTVLVTDNKITPEPSQISGQFSVFTQNMGSEAKAVLELQLEDLNRGASFTDILQIDRSSPQSRQFFKLQNPNGTLLLGNHLAVNQPFLLYHASSATTYSVRFYKRDFPMASTPYAKNEEQSFSYKADSIFTVNAQDTFRFAEKGFYHFQLNDKDKNGFTVFCFEETYPLVAKKTDLAQPLRYLTTKEEFAKINSKNADTIKLEVDKFWLKNAGNIDKARNQISEYYNRVEDANAYFTSYTEGWKTDRGIIYLVLGAPSEVYRTAFQEIWIYGNPNSSLPFTYTFTRINNPFTNNDLGLVRSLTYRYGWGRAIESWRNGNTFGEKEIKRLQDERDQQNRVTNQPYFWY